MAVRGAVSSTTLSALTKGKVIDLAGARASADQSLTSQTVLQNATGLSFPIGAGEEWIVQFNLDLGALLSTTGLQIAANAPAGATIDFDAALSNIVVTAANVLYGTTTSIATAIVLPAATLVGITNAVCSADLWCLNGANGGTIQLQFAQNTSSPTALTIRKGSYLFGFRVA